MTEAEVEQTTPDVAAFLTALVKHVGKTDVPVSVFDGLTEKDLLAIDYDPESQIVTYNLVDPSEVSFADE
jgi:hypothetical protein